MGFLSLEEFKCSPDASFSKGTWIVEYHDRTHLREGAYVGLGTIEIEECSPQGNTFFRFHPICSNQLKEHVNTAWECVEGQYDVDNATKTILDQIAESLVRLGLMQPRFEVGDFNLVNDRNSAIVVLDTNVLQNGVVRHLQEQFNRTQIWIVIPTVILMEIGEITANLAIQDSGKPTRKNCTLIRRRPQTTIAPQEVKWIKEYFPTETLELAPELLRTFRGYEKKDGDKEPDRVSINDRLILEGIKDLRRQRNLSEGVVYLMSRDKAMSRLARIEGIQTIYPEISSLEGDSGGIYSMRYSIESKSYVACSIHRLLWDLTHVFSKIRVSKCDMGNRKLSLSYYYPTKLVNDWVDDKLEVTVFGSGSITDAV